MSRLLEILGRAITVDTADLIWHWLNTVRLPVEDDQSPRVKQLNEMIELMHALYSRPTGGGSDFSA